MVLLSTEPSVVLFKYERISLRRRNKKRVNESRSLRSGKIRKLLISAIHPTQNTVIGKSGSGVRYTMKIKMLPGHENEFPMVDPRDIDRFEKACEHRLRNHEAGDGYELVKSVDVTVAVRPRHEP